MTMENTLKNLKQSTLSANNIALEIFHLRYQAYLENQSIGENDLQMVLDRYDRASNCESHLKYRNNIPAASIRACTYTPSQKNHQVPAMEIFFNEIEHNIGFEQAFVESNKFVVHPKFQHKGRRLMLSLFEFIHQKVLMAKAKIIITAVREDQVGFYRQLGFEPISGKKVYPGLDFETVLLMSDLNNVHETTSPLTRRLKKR
jgi:GNAT superfamily N-acetyltransferase